MLKTTDVKLLTVRAKRALCLRKEEGKGLQITVRLWTEEGRDLQITMMKTKNCNNITTTSRGQLL